MKYYVLQVQTGEEKKIKMLMEKTLAAQLLNDSGRLLLPCRELDIRKKGKTRKEIRPIFSGYLFWECGKFDPNVYWAVRPISGIYKFLKTNTQIVPLSGEGLRILLHFISHGELVGKSQVIFDENNRIIIKEGPLKGLEGRIVKVDKRKKRAKIHLDIYSDKFIVDFGFDILEPAKNEKK